MRRILLLSAMLCAPAIVAAQQVTVVRVPVLGTIENGLAPFVARAIREAEASGAAAVILDINTPGGRVDAAQAIVDAVTSSTVPVYAFVNRQAFSAGALIALAAEATYIRPGGVIGAATPVDGQGTKAPEKYVAAMRSEFRALAERRGIDPQLAEGMVDETLDIPGIKPKGQLLSLSAEEAIQLGFATGHAEDIQAVLVAAGLDDALVVEAVPNWAELVVRFLTNPLVSPLLLSIGMLGLIFEIKSGAFGLGGLLSLTSLGLFFGSSLLLGLAGWEELLLLGSGLIALGVEVFLIPGFGIAGIAGAGLIAAAVVFALVGNLPTANDFVSAGGILAASVVVTGAVLFGWLRHLPTSQRWSGLFLKASTNAAEGFISAPNRSDLVGREGLASTDLRPAGTAHFGDERLDVVTEGAFIMAGAAIKVVQSDGYRHIVRAV